MFQTLSMKVKKSSPSATSVNKTLSKIYYDIKHPASYGGILKLAKAASVSAQRVKEWLKTQDTYTLHKPVKYKFNRRRVLSYGIGELMQCDLADLSKFSKYNKGHKFLLTAIDVFSKRAYAIPLKNKKASTVAEGLKKLFRKSGPVSKLQTDFGKEFYNKEVQALFKKQNIHHYSSFSEYKASVVERLNRTIKNKLYKIFTHRKSHKYIDVLQKVMDSYNNSVHRSHGYAPNKVTTKLESSIFQKLYGYKTDVKFKFDLGQQVRISKSKKTFRRGYLPNWTDEVFTVYKRFLTVPPTYLLKDLKGNIVKGRFYEAEIQAVVKSSDSFWRVEKILKTRGSVPNKEYFVKWFGFTDDHNSWVKQSWIQK